MTSTTTGTSRSAPSGAHPLSGNRNVNVDVKDADVRIIVTKLFGPDGDNLVGTSGVSFDGYAAFTLLVRYEGEEGLVHLSPIHGDQRKVGMEHLPKGAKCELLCPVSKKPLTRVVDAPADDGTEYYALYLTEKLDHGSQVCISNTWGHYHSRVVDNFELISSWMADHPDSIP